MRDRESHKQAVSRIGLSWSGVSHPRFQTGPKSQLQTKDDALVMPSIIVWPGAVIRGYGMDSSLCQDRVLFSMVKPHFALALRYGVVFMVMPQIILVLVFLVETQSS